MAKQIRVHSTPDLNQRLTPELLGQAIRSKRTQSQLRLEDAATLCNVAKQTLQDIESGSGKSKFKTILQVCHGLGVRLQILSWTENHGE